MSLRVIPIPAPFTTWQDWVDSFVGLNPRLISRISPDLPWKDFAERLLLIEPKTPRPDFFENWQAWVGAIRRVLVD